MPTPDTLHRLRITADVSTDAETAQGIADDFIKANEPYITEAEAVVDAKVALNGRFDNALFEDIADIIGERSGKDQDEIDAAIRDCDEDALWGQHIGPAIDGVMDDAGIGWD